MVDDCIKRNNAINALCDGCVFRKHCSRQNNFCDQIDKVKAVPAVDAVPVIRCRDCKYSSMTLGGECKYCKIWNDKFESDDSLYLSGEFYCAFAEKKTNEVVKNG